MNAHRLGGLVLAIMILGARSALATSDFPGAIQADLKLAAPPPCSLCHVGDPGMGTVNTPFGKAMRQRRLQAGDEVSLQNALTQMETDKVDSDGDGVIDVDELVSGTNPNQAGGARVEPPSYGCQVPRAARAAGSLAPTTWASSGLPVLCIVLGLGGGARLRRRRPADS